MRGLLWFQLLVGWTNHDRTFRNYFAQTNEAFTVLVHYSYFYPGPRAHSGVAPLGACTIVHRLQSRVSTPMKLLTHNMLMSPGTRNGFPLAIEVEKLEEVEAEFNGDFMARMVEKVDYAVLISTLSSVRCGP